MYCTWYMYVHACVRMYMYCVSCVCMYMYTAVDVIMLAGVTEPEATSEPEYS